MTAADLKRFVEHVCNESYPLSDGLADAIDESERREQVGFYSWERSGGSSAKKTVTTGSSACRIYSKSNTLAVTRWA